MKYFETFAGVGGIGLGFPKEWKLVGTSEWDKYASQVLKYHNPNIRNYGDISKINWSEVPDFDVLTGGSPCQDFSIAGKRRGLAGAKSSLAWEFIRGLRSKKPKYFIWENVKGVMSSRSGWDFANILTAFSESGYSLWWQVLNSKDFGVPQNRERIFVIGFRDGSPKEVLFKRENEEVYSRPDSDEEEIHDITQTITTQSGRNATGSYIASTLTARQFASWGGNFIKQINQPKHSNNRVYAEEGISPALNTMQGGNRQPKIRVTKDGFHLARQDKKHSSIQGTHVTYPEGKSHALGTQHIPMTMQEDIRRLTPLECERLMSWPDNHTKYGINENGEVVEISDSQRYKMCGNGVVSSRRHEHPRNVEWGQGCVRR